MIERAFNYCIEHHFKKVVVVFVFLVMAAGFLSHRAFPS